jgi:dienelactone hydrolase
MAAEILTYRDGDATLHGELHQPDGHGNGCAILVVHEADGIGGNVRRRCAILAELGFVALAADMHGDGRVLEGAEMRAALDRFRSDTALLRSRVRSGLDALVAASGLDPAMTAAIGYCFGGLAVLELARSGAPLAAVASFHGLLTTAAPATPGSIQARVAAFTGARDPLVPPEHIAAFQAEMTAASADWQLSIYGRALHSFTNSAVDGLDDPRMAYDPAADRASWSAMLGFLDDSFARQDF